MKLFKLFLVAALLTATSIVQAQNSRLNGQQYTIVMIDEQNDGDEIQDIFSFNNNELKSQNMTKDGFSSASVNESGNNFEAVFSKSASETLTISGTVEGKTIYGNIVSTANGANTNYVFRGMTSTEWDAIQEKKAAAGQ
jgi:hypothetical protein